MTVKEFKEELAKHSENDIIVIYKDREYCKCLLQILSPEQYILLTDDDKTWDDLEMLDKFYDDRYGKD